MPGEDVKPMLHDPPLDTFTDKRVFFRVDTVLPLTFCLEGDDVQPLPKPTSINLSVGGAGLLTERCLAPGDSLSLTLFLPSGPPIQTRAKVVRSSPLSKPQMESTYQIGLQFFALDEKNRERLNTYIFNLQIERRRTRYHV